METKNLFDPNVSGIHDDISLKDLASHLLATMQEKAVIKNSFIINDISPAIMVTTDKRMLATVINNLLALIIERNHHSCIRITAKNFSNLVLFFVKAENKTEEKISTNDFADLQILASRVGGCITISNQKQYSETLALSFLDLANVA